MWVDGYRIFSCRYRAFASLFFYHITTITSSLLFPPGILKKWQLIFYGTATNPIRLRPSSSSSGLSGLPQQSASQNPFVFSNSQSPSASPTLDSNSYYSGSSFNPGFQNFPNIYSVSGSDPEASLAPLNDAAGKDPALQENLMGAGDDSSKKVLHNCDPECDPQGCYGKGPTQCISCKHYKLDKYDLFFINTKFLKTST
jgi:proprotein convertase subtilisin/kexin type 5